LTVIRFESAMASNIEAIPLDDIGSLIVQPSGGMQVVRNLPSSKMHWLSVESLSDRVRNLRTESASQSSLNAAAASPTAGAAESSNDEGLGDALTGATEQQTYMTAYRGSALKASRKRQAVRAQRLQAQEDETGQQKPLTQRTNCAFKLVRSIYHGLVRAYDLVTGFGSAIDDSVAADYGTGVGAFFTIYRQLAMATVLSAMSIFFFLVFPQLRPKGFGRSAYAVNNATVADAVLGRDIRPQSLLYYGAYSNKTLDGSGYDLKNAYFFTGLGFLIFNLICVAKMLTTAVQDHYVESSGELRGSSLIATVFSAWDFSMRRPRAVVQRRSAIATTFKETAVQIGKHQRQTGFSDRASSLLQLLVINVVSLLLIVVACLLLIIMFREYIYLEAQEHLSASNLLPSSGTFFANIIIGYHGFLCCLRVLSMMERHTDLHYNVTYPLVRSGLFTLATVASLAFVLHAFIFCHSSEAESDSNYFTCRVLGHSQLHDGWSVTSEANEFCWESWMAAQLYRLNFYDFFAALVSSFLLEVLPKLLSLLPLPALQRSIKLNIDISYNAACLTFSAALLWLGAFFSPPLAVFGALKILTLFFYKWLILQLCFRPSLAGMGKLLTARTITTFLFLTSLVPGLFLSFLIYSLPLSPACGPFRNDGLLKDAYFDQSNLVGFVRYVTTGTPQVLLLCLFLTMLVRVRSVAMGKEDAIRALKRYIVLENSECVRLNKQINARLRRHAERMTRNQRRQYY
ncbi:hypothetical protein BOX15_Mlig027785g1, partial [Macrostomum lignano]